MRGSTPCPCPATSGYGGNTACVALEAPGSPPLVLDLGTGLRMWGDDLVRSGTDPFRGAALVTHLHWDHIQGLPFFVPVLREGSRLDVYGPLPEDGRSLRETFDAFMQPPYFPVGIDALPGRIEFHELDEGLVPVLDAKVRARFIPHVGRTAGYRVELGGCSVAYLPDHQQPAEPGHVAESALELCDGVDLLVHDAQYTPDEFARKSDWGHCTIDYALEVAHRAGARRLVLFHHDPSHDDATLDELGAAARRRAEALAIDEVITAREGLTVNLTPAGA